MAVNNNTQPRIESVASRIGILLMATLLIAGFAKYAGNEIKSSSAATLGSAGDIYISSAKNASDLVGDGSQAKPYRSISKALSSRSVGSYTIRVASQPYVLSSADTGAALAAGPRLVVPSTAEVVLTTAFSSGDTIVRPASERDAGNLQISILGSLDISGLYFEDFRMSPTVGSGGSLDIANNYFIPAGSQTCDQVKIAAASTGTVKLDNNKFVTPVAAYSQECSMLTLAGTNRPTPSIEVVNNYFETRALRLPYQLIRSHSNDINIANNTFVSQKAPQNLDDLVAIFAVAGSKPQLGTNDFKQFQGLEIYYQQ